MHTRPPARIPPTPASRTLHSTEAPAGSGTNRRRRLGGRERAPSRRRGAASGAVGRHPAPTWNFSRMHTYIRSSIAAICSTRFTSAMRRYRTRSAESGAPSCCSRCCCCFSSSAASTAASAARASVMRCSVRVGGGRAETSGRGSGQGEAVGSKGDSSSSSSRRITPPGQGTLPYMCWARSQQYHPPGRLWPPRHGTGAAAWPGSRPPSRPLGTWAWRGLAAGDGCMGVGGSGG